MSAQLSRAEFTRQVAEAYEHLYDPVFLRAHPLTVALVPEPGLQPKERAWRLQHLLLQAIEDLDPGPQAPAFSVELRRYQLMTMHHTDGLDPQTVADRLGISRRHFYREHEVAIEAVSSVLWERYAGNSISVPPQPTPKMDRLELLRLEAARLTQTDRYARTGDVLPGVLSLLQERLHQQNLTVKADLPADLPGAELDRNLLRQMLLIMLSYLVERTEKATLRLRAWLEVGSIHLMLAVEPAEAIRPVSATEVQECMAALNDLAGLGGVSLQPLGGPAMAGFEVRLPARQQRMVLVVDDNEDVRELFQRYLASHGYRVVTAGSAADAVALAHAVQPYAITLDLMMPEQDGWEVLQTLLNQPETDHIPVIVCSVLRARELALSLGATAFLAKPVTEQALVAALAALERDA